MKIIIDIGHPAHVHLFRNFAKEFIKKGHEVLFTVHEKECNIDLLKAYQLNYKKLGKNHKTLLGKLSGIFLYEIKLLFTSFKFRPDIFMSHGSFYAAFISFLLRKKHISLEDTGNMEQVRLYLPFTYAVLTSTSFTKKISVSQVYYNSYHELAYLHPKYYSPGMDIKKSFGFNGDGKIILLRFVGKKATHDYNRPGLTDDDKFEIVETLKKYGRVIISSETRLNEKLKDYAFQISPERFHDLIYVSSVVIGNSATVASEAAMLGVPAIYLDNTGRFYTSELEKKYKLVFNFREDNEGIINSLKTAAELLKNHETASEWQEKRKQMLAEKIDLTGFLISYIEKL